MIEHLLTTLLFATDIIGEVAVAYAFMRLLQIALSAVGVSDSFCSWLNIPERFLYSRYGLLLALLLVPAIILPAFVSVGVGIWALAVVLGEVALLVLLVYKGLFILLALQAVGLIRRVPYSYNLRNVVVRWPINLLVAIAFTIVVGMLVVMLAFVNGMYRLTAGSSHPGNVIVLADGATDELFSSLGYRDVSKIEFHPLVQSDENGRKLASWESYMVISQPIPGTEQGRFIQLRGVDDPVISGKVHGLTLYDKGQWFSPAGVQEAEKDRPDAPAEGTFGQAVLGEGIAGVLGKDHNKANLEIGDTFDVGPKRWIVVGIMKSAGTTFDSEIWVKRDFAGPLFGKTGHTTCVLSTADAESASKLAADLTANYKESAIQATEETVYYDKLNSTNLQFLVAIGFVMFFMSIGGVVGVMIVMFAAISQRSKDIGVLRIVGFRSWQVLVSFFAESLVLAVLGGILGCAVGSMVHGQSATSLVSGGTGGMKSVVLRLVVDANILMLGMLFALFMGCIGGLLPALFAMRVRPLEALR